MIYLVFICFITVSIDDKNVQIPKIRSSPKKVYIGKKRFQSIDFLRSQNTCKVKSEIVGLVAICIICRSGGKLNIPLLLDHVLMWGFGCNISSVHCMTR